MSSATPWRTIFAVKNGRPDSETHLGEFKAHAIETAQGYAALDGQYRTAIERAAVSSLGRAESRGGVEYRAGQISGNTLRHEC